MTLASAMLLFLHAWWPLIEAEAKQHHVSALTLAAIVWHESRGDPNAFFQERDGACSIGLGGIRVPECEPKRALALHNPVYNLSTAAGILEANERWCRKHRDRQCRAGDRVMDGGGAVNHYGGGGVAYARTILHLRRQLAHCLPPLKRKNQKTTAP